MNISTVCAFLQAKYDSINVFCPLESNLMKCVNVVLYYCYDESHHRVLYESMYCYCLYRGYLNICRLSSNNPLFGNYFVQAD